MRSGTAVSTAKSRHENNLGARGVFSDRLAEAARYLPRML